MSQLIIAAISYCKAIGRPTGFIGLLLQPVIVRLFGKPTGFIGLLLQPVIVRLLEKPTLLD